LFIGHSGTRREHVHTALLVVHDAQLIFRVRHLVIHVRHAHLREEQNPAWHASEDWRRETEHQGAALLALFVEDVQIGVFRTLEENKTNSWSAWTLKQFRG